MTTASELLPAGTTIGQAAIETSKNIGLFAEQQFTLASAYVIDSPAMFEAAGDDLRTIEAAVKKAEARRLEITRPMDAAKKSVMDLFRGPIERLEQASKVLRTSMLTYKQAEDRKAREAQAAAEAAEAARIAELEKQAAKTKSAAKREEIEEQIEDIKTGVVVAVAPPAPKADGISSRKSWKVSSVDKAALIIACAKRLADGDDSLMPYLEVNASALAEVARAMKKNTRIPGVSVEEVESFAVRS